jgi:hypothetical protein
MRDAMLAAEMRPAWERGDEGHEKMEGSLRKASL